MTLVILIVWLTIAGKDPQRTPIVTLMPNQEACQAIRQHLRAQGAEAECLVAAPNRGDPT